jgi:hypothetical protein
LLQFDLCENFAQQFFAEKQYPALLESGFRVLEFSLGISNWESETKTMKWLVRMGK